VCADHSRSITLRCWRLVRDCRFKCFLQHEAPARLACSCRAMTDQLPWCLVCDGQGSCLVEHAPFLHHLLGCLDCAHHDDLSNGVQVLCFSVTSFCPVCTSQASLQLISLVETPVILLPSILQFVSVSSCIIPRAGVHPVFPARVVLLMLELDFVFCLIPDLRLATSAAAVLADSAWYPPQSAHLRRILILLIVLNSSSVSCSGDLHTQNTIAYRCTLWRTGFASSVLHISDTQVGFTTGRPLTQFSRL
jgi:hypothetical protein